MRRSDGCEKTTSNLSETLKRILLLSDTHAYLHPGVKKYAGECDEIWHAGDLGSLALCEELEQIKPLRAVHGNIDGHEIRIRYSEHLRFTSEGVKVWITHIGGYPGRYDRKILPMLKANKPDLFICGHSHILKVMRDKNLGLMFMNPGAAGLYGVQKVSTLLRFTLDQGSIRDLQVIELNRVSES